MSVWIKLMPKSFEPVRAIEWAIALISLLTGLYIFSPLYEQSVKIHGKSSFATALESPMLILVFAAILIAGTFLLLIGLKQRKPQFRSSGLFTIFLVRFFQVSTTIGVTGFTPITWIHPFTVGVVCFLLWISTRIEVFNGRS